MLHTKFHDIGPLVRKKKILKGFTLYWHGGHLGHVTWTPRTNFRSPIPWMLHMKFNFIGPVVLEENIFENVDRRQTTDNRRRQQRLVIL